MDAPHDPQVITAYLESKEEIAMAMLEVKDLHVYYGMIQAIKGTSEVNQETIALT